MKRHEPQQKCEAGPGQCWRVDSSHAPRSFIRCLMRLQAIQAVKTRYGITDPEATFVCEIVDMRDLPPGAMFLI